MSTIDKSNLKKKLENKDNFLLLDVRTPQEFQGGNIQTSKNVPVQNISVFQLKDDEFEKQTGFTKPKTDEEVIVYCKMGGRAAAAQNALQQMGYQKVINYAGSWMDWTS